MQQQQQQDLRFEEDASRQQRESRRQHQQPPQAPHEQQQQQQQQQGNGGEVQEEDYGGVVDEDAQLMELQQVSHQAAIPVHHRHHHSQHPRAHSTGLITSSPPRLHEELMSDNEEALSEEGERGGEASGPQCNGEGEGQSQPLPAPETVALQYQGTLQGPQEHHQHQYRHQQQQHLQGQGAEPSAEADRGVEIRQEGDNQDVPFHSGIGGRAAVVAERVREQDYGEGQQGKGQQGWANEDSDTSELQGTSMAEDRSDLFGERHSEDLQGPGAHEADSQGQKGWREGVGEVVTQQQPQLQLHRQQHEQQVSSAFVGGRTQAKKGGNTAGCSMPVGDCLHPLSQQSQGELRRQRQASLSNREGLQLQQQQQQWVEMENLGKKQRRE